MSEPVAANQTVTPDALPRPPRSRVAIALNLVGFALGLALLWWCGARALSPTNRAQLEMLAKAPIWQAGSMVALSFLSVGCSGMAFWAALAPVRKLPKADCIGVNFIAALGNYMPFKLGLIFRIFTHNRRNGVPLLTIGAWMGSMGVLMICTLGPILLTSYWRQRIDVLWWLTSMGGIVVACGLVLLAARVAASKGGWALITRIWRSLPMPRKLRDSTVLDRAHEGARMIGSPGAIAGVVFWRLADLFTQALRFLVASAIVGRAIHWEESILAASTYFLIGSASPTGQLGVREEGTARLVRLVLPDVNLEEFSLIVLMVTAAELVALLVGGAIALAYLARTKDNTAPAA